MYADLADEQPDALLLVFAPRRAHHREHHQVAPLVVDGLPWDEVRLPAPVQTISLPCTSVWEGEGRGGERTDDVAGEGEEEAEEGEVPLRGGRGEGVVQQGE